MQIGRSGVWAKLDRTGFPLVPARSSDTLRLDGLVLERESQQCWIIANLTAESQTVEVRGITETPLARRLNESNVVRAIMNPAEFRGQRGEPLGPAAGRLHLQLMPYEVCRIDLARRGK